MSALAEALQAYQHPAYRVVSICVPKTRDKEIDNYSLMTAHAVDLLDRLDDEQGAHEQATWGMAFARACMNEGENGLLRRYPQWPGETSWDEMIGAAFTAWYACEFDIPFSMMEYGLRSDWSWNAERPSEWSFHTWLARNLMLTPMLRGASHFGEDFVRKPTSLTVGVVSQLQWSAGLLLSFFDPSWKERRVFTAKGNTSGRLLCHVQLRPMQDISWITQTAVLIWRAGMRRIYPGGRRELFSIFLPPDHPLAAYQPTHWEK